MTLPDEITIFVDVLLSKPKVYQSDSHQPIFVVTKHDIVGFQIIIGKPAMAQQFEYYQQLLNDFEHLRSIDFWILNDIVFQAD